MLINVKNSDTFGCKELEIVLKNIGKKFNKNWIFKSVEFTFDEHSAHAIVGSNGSGKSTLLQIISSKMIASEGEILYKNNGVRVESADVFRYLNYTAPYIELIEEFTLNELLTFHFTFKQLDENHSFETIKQNIQLPENKPIRYFSSGMKMKLKLALSMFSKGSLLLLDEPCSNFDNANTTWYQQEMQKILGKKTIIIASNNEAEFSFCKHVLNIADYKNG